MPQRIVRVHPGSLAARSGIREGETLVSINRTPVLDLVDYQYLTARPSLEMLLEDNDGQSRTVHVHKLVEEPLGLTLESSLMSCPKTCANHCMFCFIEQMPPGMRPSLYVRDDDWRLSLMAGNFVTLTNLPPQEMDRMIERHASPLYISVQTTNGELRKKMRTSLSASPLYAGGGRAGHPAGGSVSKGDARRARYAVRLPLRRILSDCEASAARCGQL